MKGRPQSPKKDDNSQLTILVAFKADNISISGKGTIGGQGTSLAINVDSLHHAGIVIDPDYSVETNARPDINYDIRVYEAGNYNPLPASIVGILGNYIENVTLENIKITYPGRTSKGQAYFSLNRLSQLPEKTKNYPEFSMFGELLAWAFYVCHAKGLQFKNVTLTLENEDFRPAFVFDDINNLKMDKIDLPTSNKKEIILNQSSHFQLDDNAHSLKKEL